MAWADTWFERPSEKEAEGKWLHGHGTWHKEGARGRPIGCQSQAAARARHGTWSESALAVPGKVSADSACLGGAGVDAGKLFTDTDPIAYLSA